MIYTLKTSGLSFHPLAGKKSSIKVEQPTKICIAKGGSF